jgi:hypothetical protein
MSAAGSSARASRWSGCGAGSRGSTEGLRVVRDESQVERERMRHDQGINMHWSIT